MEELFQLSPSQFVRWNSATLMKFKSNPKLCFGSTALQFCKEQWAEITAVWNTQSLLTAQSALTFREQFSFKFNKCAKNNNNQRVGQCRTWAAQRACGRPRSRWPSGSFHWGRQTGRREPNTHRPAHLDHCWTEAWTKRWDKETPDKITQTRGPFNIGTGWSVQEIWL